MFTGTLNAAFLPQGNCSVLKLHKAVFRITGHGAASTLHQHRSNAIKYFSCCTISNRRAGAVFETFVFSDNVLNILLPSEEIGRFSIPIWSSMD